MSENTRDVLEMLKEMAEDEEVQATDETPAESQPSEPHRPWYAAFFQ